MPKIIKRRSNKRMLSLDTETTGLDLNHGARPYLVTTADAAGDNAFWEWDVDPATRAPIVPKSDLDEIQELVLSVDEIRLQNPKFDVSGLTLLYEDYNKRLIWPWHKTKDTLSAGHLLASNQAHDLTTMTMVYLRTNTQPYEDRLEDACKACRKLAKDLFPEIRIAKEGLPEMPSAKPGNKTKKTARGVEQDNAWKFDSWLPRHIVKRAVLDLRFDILPSDPRQPSVGHVRRCTIKIDRTSKWGNPYAISKDGTREEVIAKYAEYILRQPDLLASLSELYGEHLGCYCSPDLCHGDVLRALCHPWFTVCSDYANSDSTSTGLLYDAQYEIITKRKLNKIYQVRLQFLPVIAKMEKAGVTFSYTRLAKLEKEFAQEAKACSDICINLSGGRLDRLPISGASNALKETLTEHFGLESAKATKKGNPSYNKYVLESWLATLPRSSAAYLFVRNLQDYRKRSTSIGYMASYRKFGIKLSYEWRRLHPFLNPTGTDTLRLASYNPNEQNISKQETYCTDCHGEGKWHDGEVCVTCGGKGKKPNIRFCFGPMPGREWWSADAQNIELRLPAYKSGQQVLIDLFERPEEPPYYGSTHLLNFHTVYPDIWDTAVREVGLDKAGPYCKKRYADSWYQWCKNGGFAVQYGAVEREQGTADLAFHRAGSHARLKARFDRLAELNQSCIDHGKKYGYIETMPDMEVDPERGYPLLCSRNQWGGVLETTPLNYYIQGTACWWMMVGMINCDKFLAEHNSKLPVEKHIHMIMNVHDELVFDFPYAPNKGNLPIMTKLARIMAASGDRVGVPTPVSVEFHRDNWSEGETCGTSITLAL